MSQSSLALEIQLSAIAPAPVGTDTGMSARFPGFTLSVGFKAPSAEYTTGELSKAANCACSDGSCIGQRPDASSNRNPSPVERKLTKPVVIFVHESAGLKMYSRLWLVDPTL